MEIEVLARLEAALDELAALDHASLSGDELGALVVGLHRLDGRLSAQRFALIGALDTRRVWRHAAYPTASSWLAHRCRLTSGRARRELRHARVLPTLPVTAAALADGSISVDAMQAIVRADQPATAVALQRDEAMLVDHARQLDVVDVERVVRYWEQQADADGVEQAAAERHDHRRVSCSPGIDGHWLQGWLPTVAGATFTAELERLERQLFDDDWKTAVAEHGETVQVSQLARTPTQRRADALVEMAVRSATAPAGGRRPAPLVTILVGYETFAGRICQLASGQTVTPGEVAALLDDAVIERVLFDGPSRVIDVGHQRLFTGALRRAIQVRDRTCIEAGCHVPAEQCEIDHLHPAAHHGPTTQANGALRCPFHHHQRHRNDDARPPPD